MLYNALNIPPEASQNGGDELVRAAISSGSLSMSLRRGFDDPEAWGRVLAEVVKQVAQVYALETRYSKEAAAKRIIEAFANDVAASTPDAPSPVAKR